MRPRARSVLLLNPPSARPVFRDCYCSGPSKGTFYMHPLDLQVQSGFFARAGYELETLDAVFERLSPARSLERISRANPDVILALVGAASLEQDTVFLRRLKSACPQVGLYLSGDVARFEPQKTLRAIPDADGLLLDFGSSGLVDLLDGGQLSADVVLRDGAAGSSASGGDLLATPLPAEAFVLCYPYRLPFFSEPRFYSLTSSFGCPYGCRYCNTHLLGYRERPVEAVLQELRFAAALGFQSLYVRDATFLVNRARSLELFERWAETDLSFQWICFARPDRLDETLISWAARLGCKMMMLGVESYDERWLDDMSKRLDLNAVRETLRLLERYGIRSTAQIMVGAEHLDPNGASGVEHIRQYERRLWHLLRELDPDYVSLNVFYRRPGLQVSDSSLARIEEGRAVYQGLAGRINRRFYLAPRAVLRQVRSIQSLKQFSLVLGAALRLVGG